jgi:hypothetical protein
VRTKTAAQIDERHGEFYEYTVYHKSLEYESRWRASATGDLGHATQMRYSSAGISDAWSIVDLALYILLFIKLARGW